MKKYLIVFSKSMKSQFVYRSSAIASLCGSMLSFFIQICLWHALLGAGVKNGANFSDMVLFVIINSFIAIITSSNISGSIEAGMIDGSIALELIRPISYKYYQFAGMAGRNVFRLVTNVVPVLAAALFLIDYSALPSPPRAAAFLLSLILGVLIMFELNYLFGLSAFWIQRCWFISWYTRAFTTFFGGTAVPLWFYPDALKNVSFFLPFRYVSFEPINIFLGKTPAQDVWIPIAAAFMWLITLGILGRIIWYRAVKRLSVNGG